MDNTPGNGTRMEGYNFGYAKNCGATNAPNVICCPRTACDHTPLAKHEKSPRDNPKNTKQWVKRCVDCGSQNEYAAECLDEYKGTLDSDYWSEDTLGPENEPLKKICCTGLKCVSGKCRQRGCAADSKKSKECGASNAKFDSCCEGHVCVGRKCVRSSLMPCAREGTRAKECAITNEYTPFYQCCLGLVCGASNTCEKE